MKILTFNFSPLTVVDLGSQPDRLSWRLFSGAFTLFEERRKKELLNGPHSPMDKLLHYTHTTQIRKKKSR